MITNHYISISKNNSLFVNETSPIKTVQLYKNNNQLSYPIINLNSDEKLTLCFDELAETNKIFKYTFVHCNSKWTPSPILYNDCIDGFEENEILNFKLSLGTHQKYVHYWVNFPDEEIKFKLSGNYLVKVYTGNLNQSDEKVLFTKQFYVTENKIAISAAILRPQRPENQKIKQQIKITLAENLDYKIDFPSQNLKIKVSQNGRMDNQLILESPQFIKGDILEYNSEINLFDGGNEFQNFDSRSLRFHSTGIYSIKTIMDTINVALRSYENRASMRYFNTIDMNGKYFINRQETAQDYNNESEYSMVHFYFPENNQNSNPLYIFGGLTNWEINDSFLMHYNAEKMAYEATAFLKQGFYDYQIIEKFPDNTLDVSFIDGNHFQTNNEYLIFVYYQSPTDRYEKLIGYQLVYSDLSRY